MRTLASLANTLTGRQVWPENEPGAHKPASVVDADPSLKAPTERITADVLGRVYTNFGEDAAVAATHQPDWTPEELAAADQYAEDCRRVTAAQRIVADRWGNDASAYRPTQWRGDDPAYRAMYAPRSPAELQAQSSAAHAAFSAALREFCDALGIPEPPAQKIALARNAWRRLDESSRGD